MRILICSHVFAPSIGGTEIVGKLLAQEFVALGHDVCVITQTGGSTSHPFDVIRKPSALELLRRVRWADVVFHNNISLRAVWPLIFLRKPWFVTHHTWLAHGGLLAEKIKRWVLRFATNIAISSEMAKALPVPSRVITDPYDADLFYLRRGTPRDHDLLFVGRLVSDKGCDLLLDALEILKSRGHTPSLTIVGDGPDRAPLERRARSQIRFIGALESEALAKCYNEHRILVVPSRWKEPFGIVALEGIASGCVVVGSSGGGLSEAIGNCGRVFENGNANALAAALQEVLAADPGEFTRHSEAHLKPHHPSVVAQKYLECFQARR